MDATHQFSLPMASPLKQHPVSPVVPSSPPDTSRTLFLDYPSARLSSSPASSPRIVDAPPTRRESVHPAMSETMKRGMEPGADFFDDASSDSEWEDSEGDMTRTFSEVEGLGLRSAGLGLDDKEHRLRGRGRERTVTTALPPFHQLTTHDSGLGIEDDDILSLVDNKGTKKAREVSLQRLSKDKVRLVHTRSNAGTPRDSLRSNISAAASPLPELLRPSPNLRPGEASANAPRSNSFKGHHRRNTSESVIADSIIDAHVRTLRALESLSPSGSLSHAQGRSYLPSADITDLPKSQSFTVDRHIKLPPHSSTDRDRPAHLPSHFIRTPYPFTAKKEFPQPKSRPRQRGEDERNDRGAGEFTKFDGGYDEGGEREYDDRKGKHILGLVTSEGDYDLRSRLERNKAAQGVVLSRAGSGKESTESVVWLSLQRGAWRKKSAEEASKQLVPINVPSNLTTSSPSREGKGAGSQGEIDFDDKFFAERLRAGHRQLAGNWFIRTFSARKLRCIQLGRTSTWSGSASQGSSRATCRLLATGEGIDRAADSRSPFTEVALTKLYKKPAIGKARYTWVHWARRVAASDSLQHLESWRDHPSTRSYRRRARSLDYPRKQDDELAINTHSDSSSSSTSLPDTITTIQFVHSLSTLRILAALTLMLALSVLAALLWIFIGAAGTGPRLQLSGQRSDRVGSGMAIGILVLLLEGVGFGAWVWLS